MAENPVSPKEKKPGTFRIALAALILFAVVVLPLIAKYVWQAPVNNELLLLIGTIVGGLIGNIDRIFASFFPKKE